MAWPLPNILRTSCYQWSPRVGMLAPSSLTTLAIVPELDASWHCAGPRSYSCFVMRTRSICWSRTSSPPAGKLRSLRRTPLSQHWTSWLWSGCLVCVMSWRWRTSTLWLLSKWPTRDGTQFKGCQRRCCGWDWPARCSSCVGGHMPTSLMISMHSVVTCSGKSARTPKPWLSHWW